VDVVRVVIEFVEGKGKASQKKKMAFKILWEEKDLASPDRQQSTKWGRIWVVPG
jgi:hypothetical protein